VGQIIVLAMWTIGISLAGYAIDGGPTLKFVVLLAWLYLVYWIHTERFERIEWLMPIVAVIFATGCVGVFVFLVRRAAE
jgi:hypothetical protein